MLLGVVLLYVGAVLAVNGIWLIGQARAAQAAPAPVAAGAREDRAEVSASAGGRGVEPAPARAERSPLLIQGREVAVLNIFTGFVGVVIAVILLVQGSSGDLASVRGGGFILLFAFTYLWVAFNQFLDAGGHAFGWYCLFVAITAIPAGIYTLQNAGGNPALVWLGDQLVRLGAVVGGVLGAAGAGSAGRAARGVAGDHRGHRRRLWALGFAVLIGALAF